MKTEKEHEQDWDCNPVKKLNQPLQCNNPT